MKSVLDKLQLNDISNILIVGDENYFIDSNKEVEVISKEKVVCTRLLDYNDFLDKKKRTIYFKYNNIILEERYVDLLKDLKYLYSDTNFKLGIILAKDYKIEYNNDIISLLKDNNFTSKIYEDLDGYILIEIKR
ncbi:MAG: hypothetical protein RR425_05335 [Erysipelotrichales bacterium]